MGEKSSITTLFACRLDGAFKFSGSAGLSRAREGAGVKAALCVRERDFVTGHSQEGSRCASPSGRCSLHAHKGH